MNAKYNTIQRRIEQLCDSMDDSILVSLLLLRQLSEEGSQSLFMTDNDDERFGYYL